MVSCRFSLKTNPMNKWIGGVFFCWQRHFGRLDSFSALNQVEVPGREAKRIERSATQDVAVKEMLKNTTGEAAKRSQRGFQGLDVWESLLWMQDDPIVKAKDKVEPLWLVCRSTMIMTVLLEKELRTSYVLFPLSQCVGREESRASWRLVWTAGGAHQFPASVWPLQIRVWCLRERREVQTAMVPAWAGRMSQSEEIAKQ